MDMNSVERVLYANNVEPETALTTDSDPNIEEG